MGTTAKMTGIQSIVRINLNFEKFYDSQFRMEQL